MDNEWTMMDHGCAMLFIVFCKDRIQQVDLPNLAEEIWLHSIRFVWLCYNANVLPATKKVPESQKQNGPQLPCATLHQVLISNFCLMRSTWSKVLSFQALVALCARFSCRAKGPSHLEGQGCTACCTSLNGSGDQVTASTDLYNLSM